MAPVRTLLDREFQVRLPRSHMLYGSLNKPGILLFKPVCRKAVGNQYNGLFRTEVSAGGVFEPGFKGRWLYLAFDHLETLRPERRRFV